MQQRIVINSREITNCTRTDAYSRAFGTSSDRKKERKKARKITYFLNTVHIEHLYHFLAETSVTGETLAIARTSSTADTSVTGEMPTTARTSSMADTLATGEMPTARTSSMADTLATEEMPAITRTSSMADTFAARETRQQKQGKYRYSTSTRLPPCEDGREADFDFVWSRLINY